ncbi:hypothetical protein ATANTOWER_027135 [Ataeniobius toweri]|uniref:Uncharacterized protein n=1 Tax=Ataeniobius toweri TaxID=208326 RepID=A0ABU7CDH8_9TELE|nr:hypothetical protein [Ataeniobius toweri]
MPVMKSARQYPVLLAGLIFWANRAVKKEMTGAPTIQTKTCTAAYLFLLQSETGSVYLHGFGLFTFSGLSETDDVMSCDWLGRLGYGVLYSFIRFLSLLRLSI